MRLLGQQRTRCLPDYSWIGRDYPHAKKRLLHSACVPRVKSTNWGFKVDTATNRQRHQCLWGRLRFQSQLKMTKQQTSSQQSRISLSKTPVCLQDDVCVLKNWITDWSSGTPETLKASCSPFVSGFWIISSKANSSQNLRYTKLLILVDLFFLIANKLFYSLGLQVRVE